MRRLQVAQLEHAPLCEHFSINKAFSPHPAGGGGGGGACLTRYALIVH